MEFYILGKTNSQPRIQRWSEKLTVHIDRLGRAIGSFRDRVGPEMAVDLGTTNTRMYLRGRGIFVDEPSVLATDSLNGEPLSAGSNAKNLIGRSPDYVALHKPLCAGAIADAAHTALMLRYLIASARKGNFPRWYRMAVTAPSCGTRLERRAIIEAATKSGAAKVLLVPTLIAAAIGVGYKINSPRARMLVLLGGGVCEVGIVGLGHIIYSDAARVGGETIDHAIYEYLLHRYNIQITMEMAEKIKEELVYAESSATPHETMRVTGREARKGGLKSIEMRPPEISRAVETPINCIVDLIQEALDNCSPTVLSDLENFPIILSGGLSLLHGLPELIVKMTGFRVAVAANPSYTTLKGCSAIVDDPKQHIYCLTQA